MLSKCYLKFLRNFKIIIRKKIENNVNKNRKFYFRWKNFLIDIYIENFYKKKKNGEVYKTDLKIVQNLKLISDVYEININKRWRK